MTALIASLAGLTSTAASTAGAAAPLAASDAAASPAPLARPGTGPAALSFPATLAELAAGAAEQAGPPIATDGDVADGPSPAPATGAHGVRAHAAHTGARHGRKDCDVSPVSPLIDAPTAADAPALAMAAAGDNLAHQTERNTLDPSVAAGQTGRTDGRAPAIAPAGRAGSSPGSLPTTTAMPDAQSGRLAEHPMPSAGAMPVAKASTTDAMPSVHPTASPPASAAVRSSAPDVSNAPGPAAVATRPAKSSPHDDRVRTSSAVAYSSPATGLLERAPAVASELAGTAQGVTAASTPGSTPAVAPAVGPNLPAPVALPDQQPTLLNSIAELRARPDGVHELNVTLHPAELGAVHVRATLHGGILDVTVACADAGARDAVTAALPGLHHQLGSMTSLDVRLADATARETAPQTSAGSRDETGHRPGNHEPPPEQRPRTRDDPADSAAGFERWM